MLSSGHTLPENTILAPLPILLLAGLVSVQPAGSANSRYQQMCRPSWDANAGVTDHRAYPCGI